MTLIIGWRRKGRSELRLSGRRSWCRNPKQPSRRRSRCPSGNEWIGPRRSGMKPHYLHLPLHTDGLEQSQVQSQKRLRWLIVRLALLVLFLIGLSVIG